MAKHFVLFNVYSLSQYYRSYLASEISYLAENSQNSENFRRISRLQYANASISFSRNDTIFPQNYLASIRRVYSKFGDDWILSLDFRHNCLKISDFSVDIR